MHRKARSNKKLAAIEGTPVECERGEEECSITYHVIIRRTTHLMAQGI